MKSTSEGMIREDAIEAPCNSGRSEDACLESALPEPSKALGPAVVVVVLNWCEEDLTRACLHSLQDATYPNLTVLLVDNGSHDGSGERLRREFSQLAFLQTGGNRGYTGGNNRGIDWALDRNADYVLILNNDTEVSPESVGRMVATAEQAGEAVGGVVPKILFHDDPDRIWYAGGHFCAVRGLGRHWREGEADDPAADVPSEVTFMSGCCCLLSSVALREVGGFRETLFAYVEDAELSIRFSDAGYRMLYQPGARVLHHSLPPGQPPSPFQIRQRDTNRRWVMRTHFGPVRRLPFLVRFYLTRTMRLLQYLLRGDVGRARAILEGSIGR